MPSVPTSSSNLLMLAPPITTPTSAGFMSPSGTRVDLNDTKKKERRNSHTGQNHLNDTGMVIQVIPFLNDSIPR